jgi:hypothetical protein
MFDRKTKSLKYKKLDVSVGVLEAEKKGFLSKICG